MKFSNGEGCGTAVRSILKNSAKDKEMVSEIKPNPLGRGMRFPERWRFTRESSAYNSKQGCKSEMKDGQQGNICEEFNFSGAFFFLSIRKSVFSTAVNFLSILQFPLMTPYVVAFRRIKGYVADPTFNIGAKWEQDQISSCSIANARVHKLRVSWKGGDHHTTLKSSFLSRQHI